MSEDEYREETRLRLIREVAADYLSALSKREPTVTKRPKVTLPGKVAKVIRPRHAAEPEKAQIKVDDADPLYDEIRVKNELKDEKGNRARLKEGAEVDVIVEAPKHAVDGDEKK